MDSPSPTERSSVLTTAADVVAEVPAGATIGIGGILTSCHPMAIVRELIKQGVGDLHVVGLASGLEVDMLIAAGLVRRVSTPTVSAEARSPIAPAYRRAAQAGEIELWECDEGLVYAALRAGAQRVPFTPWPAGIGTSLPEINDGMVEIESPFEDGRRLLAVRAIELDFSFAHAARSDRFGNVQTVGGGFGDAALARASKRAVYTVDRIVSNHEVRLDPGSTAIAGVDAVVHAPFGAHPFSSPGSYLVDGPWLDEYLRACHRWVREGDRGELEEFFERWVSGPADHWEYMDRVGIERLHGLEEGLH
ncbi:MAG: CoA-transferase [Solirubrobacterales bacterium]